MWLIIDSVYVCHRLLYGLGINQLGLQMAKEISSQFDGDFRAFWSYIRAAAATEEEGGSPSVDRLTSINGFGPVVMNAVMDFARDEQSVAMVEGLLMEINFSENNKSSNAEGKGSAVADSPLSGRKVVFTGAFECGITRKEAQDMCIALGMAMSVHFCC